MCTLTVPAVLAAVGIVATLALSPSVASSQAAPSQTQVVLLGTGNPGPSPERSGAATAIVGRHSRTTRLAAHTVPCSGETLILRRRSLRVLVGIQFQREF